MPRPKDIDGIDIPRIPSPPPPTEEEHRRMVETLEELRLWREKLLAERGGSSIPTPGRSSTCTKGWMGWVPSGRMSSREPRA